MQDCKLIVLNNVETGREDECNDWCSDARLDDALQVPGIVSAQRLRCAELQGDLDSHRWAYMVIYECQAEDIRQVIDGLKARSGAEGNSATHEALYISYFEPSTDLKRKTALLHGSAVRGVQLSAEKNPHLTPANAARNSEADLTQQRRGDLGSMRVEDWAGPVAGPTYLEANLQIPRSTLHRWQRRNQVIALRKGLGRHVFPLAQFVDGRPVPGISDVLALAKHPRLAWSWLICPSPHLDGRIPVELLREDMVAEVLQAARLSC